MLRIIIDILVIAVVSVLGIYLGILWYRLVDRKGWRGWYSDD